MILKRRAMTLIELLVVISIIGLLAAIGAYFYPSLQGRQNVSNGVDQVTGALLAAKQRAKRDGLPTGIRLVFNGQNIASEIQYIQQPDDFAEGTCISISGTTLTFQNANFTRQLGEGAESTLVTPGDYIELYGGGPMHQIATIVDANTLTLVGGSSALPPSPMASSLPNYRIIPQPRLLAGEQVVKLPGGVGIDRNTVQGIQLSTIASRQVRAATSGGSVTTYFEILFAPSGSVISQATAGGQIYLWVRDITVNNTSDLRLGNPTIVAIQQRSGFIAAHPVATTADPFAYTRDARSSGM